MATRLPSQPPTPRANCPAPSRASTAAHTTATCQTLRTCARPLALPSPFCRSLEVRAGTPGWWRRARAGPVPSPWVPRLDTGEHCRRHQGPPGPHLPQPSALRVRDGAVADAHPGTLTLWTCSLLGSHRLLLPPTALMLLWSLVSSQAAPRAPCRHREALPGAPRSSLQCLWLLAPHWTTGPSRQLPEPPGDGPPFSALSLSACGTQPSTVAGGQQVSGRARAAPQCWPPLGAKPPSPTPDSAASPGSFFALTTCHL